MILANAMGFWANVFKTHTPVKDISGIAALKFLINDLNNTISGLANDAQFLERLEPEGFTSNTEYPFLTDTSEWCSPVAEFGEGDAKRYHNTARLVLVTIQSLHGTTIATGQEPIPSAIV